MSLSAARDGSHSTDFRHLAQGIQLHMLMGITVIMRVVVVIVIMIVTVSRVVVRMLDLARLQLARQNLLMQSHESLDCSRIILRSVGGGELPATFRLAAIAAAQ